MLRRCLHKTKDNRAQSILEYTIVVGVVVTIFFGMGTMITRGSQGMIKSVADLIGNQQNGDQRFVAEDGFMLSSHVNTDSSTEKSTSDYAGTVTYYYDDRTESESKTVSTMGYAEDSH